jgi:hypothetical protein
MQNLKGTQWKQGTVTTFLWVYVLNYSHFESREMENKIKPDITFSHILSGG